MMRYGAEHDIIMGVCTLIVNDTIWQKCRQKIQILTILEKLFRNVERYKQINIR